MTARDEAHTAAITQAKIDRLPISVLDCIRMVDAIPDDVLARLAIERGALKWVQVGTPDDTGRVFITDGQDFYRELDDYEDSVLWMVES